MVVKKQEGFTLVEVTLVMAIAAGLLLIILKGFSITRSRSEFQASIEQLTQEVLQERSIAADDVNANETGTDDHTNGLGTVNFGVLLTFQNGSSQVIENILTTPNISPPDNAQAVAIDGASRQVYTLPWGTTFSSPDGANRYVAFTRSLSDGSLRTTVFDSAPTYTYGAYGPSASESLKFVSPGTSQAATINIDASNNAVTRTYQ